MYIRFQSGLRDTCSRGKSGIFCAAEYFWDTCANQRNGWQAFEISRQLRWFNENLRVPQKLFYRPEKKAEISGVCWFKAASSRCVSEGRYLAWLLSDVGLPISERRQDHLGTIIWEDDDQVVALRQKHWPAKRSTRASHV